MDATRRDEDIAAAQADRQSQSNIRGRAPLNDVSLPYGSPEPGENFNGCFYCKGPSPLHTPPPSSSSSLEVGLERIREVRRSLNREPIDHNPPQLSWNLPTSQDAPRPPSTGGDREGTVEEQQPRSEIFYWAGRVLSTYADQFDAGYPRTTDIDLHLVLQTANFLEPYTAEPVVVTCCLYVLWRAYRRWQR